MAIAGIPEVDSVVGKIGRAETPLDPAPISMIETVINYRPEYVTDRHGRRVRYHFDHATGRFLRDADGALIEDVDGRPYRQWRDHIRSPEDIWDEIVGAAQIPGTTSAPLLQPIMTRIIMLRSGMRAPMGVKVKGPDLDAISRFSLALEQALKDAPGVDPTTVVADRIVGKPYIEVKPDALALSRFGLNLDRVLGTLQAAVGGLRVTTTVEGRERYPVRVRYMRELRDSIEQIGRVLIPTGDGAQIPLEQLADIRYVRGPQVIKSEDTFLIGYVTFGKKPGLAEIEVVRSCREHLEHAIEQAKLTVPPGISYEFAGTYESHLRARRTLSVILPAALLVIFLILYCQFRSASTAMLVFSGIALAWAGGFLLLWLYNQPWFMDFDVFGTSMRALLQMPSVDAATGRVMDPVNLSVAVWVGFLALFGIASDNGVVLATYLNQSFEEHPPVSVREIRDATLRGAERRIRPCLMTSATTILALLPVLTSSGRGSDVMVPMAIPSFGGMPVVIVSVFAVPVFYCAVQEWRLRLSRPIPPRDRPQRM
jgi:Cu(I)/Ag(I) efflux system membrane protein CusA/SilA